MRGQRRLVEYFGRERRITANTLPRQRVRARELSRIEDMRYPEARSLGRRFRPLQQLALAMRARHVRVVKQLPLKMRKLREYQARFYMLNAPDSPVAVAGRYASRHIYPLAQELERLSRRVGGSRCLPSQN
jgi:hypothetical protein